MVGGWWLLVGWLVGGGDGWWVVAGWWVSGGWVGTSGDKADSNSARSPRASSICISW